MQIYNNEWWKLEQMKEIWFNLEKDMQKLSEDNMENIFWLEFIKTEFQLNNLRIDSLAFDNESNSFVIIEYKRWNSYSVIDQWMSYLALMLNNKADFVQELWKKRNEFIDTKSIDWSQSRIIIIADSFNRYQKESINFKDLAIDLWELKQFNNWAIVFNPIKASNTTESIKTVTKYDTWELKNVNKEIKTYTVDDHFKDGWEKSRELYDELKERILLLDSRIIERPVGWYIWYNIWNKNVITLKIQKSKLVIELIRVEPKDLNDPENKTINIDWAMKWWNVNVSKYYINNSEDIDYWIMLIKQLLKRFF
jgi:predicted transport protein